MSTEASQSDLFKFLANQKKTASLDSPLTTNGKNDKKRKIRRTVALYSDELRFCIIEEVFKRPLLWDTTNREPSALLQRKELFEEIADILRHLDNTLNAIIVEKQWKNLKDTYNKVKKKITVDENGDTIYPKWRFYNSMSFIDHDSAENNNVTMVDQSLNKSEKPINVNYNKIIYISQVSNIRRDEDDCKNSYSGKLNYSDHEYALFCN